MGKNGLLPLRPEGNSAMWKRLGSSLGPISSYHFVSERRSGLRPMPAVRRTLRRRWRRHFDDDVVGVDSDVDVVELPDEGADVVSTA